jgi:fumarate hydratase subunit alpha
MRTIDFNTIAAAVEDLCMEAAHKLQEDVLAALQKAAANESVPQAKGILSQLIENAQIAESEMIPLCQDTGLAIIFVDHGGNIQFVDENGRTLFDAVNAGIAAGYENGFLRKSVVADPLKDRKNTNTNTPAVIHYRAVAGDKLKLSLMAKGGGCENKSQFKMFRPTAAQNEIIDWIVDVVKQAGADACPPFVIGIGIGGDFEQCCLMSKRSLLRRLDEPNSDKFYADIERDILEKVNASGIGPQGFGGDTTALGCMIETEPCHIASLPVAVNIECHSHRHRTVIL